MNNRSTVITGAPSKPARWIFDAEGLSRARAQLELRAPQTVQSDMAAIFAALGDPTRLKILCALTSGEMCVGDLAALLGNSSSAVSHQLHELRALRLVRSKRIGKMVFYSLDDEHVLSLLDVALVHVQERRANGV